MSGDFNVVAAQSEYSGTSNPNPVAMANFSDFLIQSALQELQVAGGIFTWTGVRSRGQVWKKLDRMLFNFRWLEVFA